MEDQEIYSVENDEIVYGNNLNFNDSIKLLNNQLNKKSFEKFDVYIQDSIDFYFNNSLALSLCGGNFQNSREIKTLLRNNITKPLRFPRKRKRNA
tara:strand:+ start:126 stop:410 length:285 start_codon:yes stop_codon:yes gene_type:complete